MLTPAELEAIDLAGRLAEKVGEIVGNGPTRAHDLNELLAHVHVIQHAVMSQAAARSYPQLFRLLGGTVG